MPSLCLLHSSGSLINICFTKSVRNDSEPKQLRPKRPGPKRLWAETTRYPCGDSLVYSRCSIISYSFFLSIERRKRNNGTGAIDQAIATREPGQGVPSHDKTNQSVRLYQHLLEKSEKPSRHLIGQYFSSGYVLAIAQGSFSGASWRYLCIFSLKIT